MPTDTPNKADPLTREEVAAVLAAVDPWWRPYVTVAFGTGARPNDLLGLQRGDLDFRGGTFRIERGRVRRHVGALKTAASVRDVPMLGPVADAFRRALGQQAAVRISGADYVFTDRRGAPVSLKQLEAAWHAALRRAEVRDGRLYQCKHTFISTALSEGEPPFWVSAVTGVSLATIHKHYAKWIPGQHDGGRFAVRMWGAAPPPALALVPRR